MPGVRQGLVVNSSNVQRPLAKLDEAGSVHGYFLVPAHQISLVADAALEVGWDVVSAWPHEGQGSNLGVLFRRKGA